MAKKLNIISRIILLQEFRSLNDNLWMLTFRVIENLHINLLISMILIISYSRSKIPITRVLLFLHK